MFYVLADDGTLDTVLRCTKCGFLDRYASDAFTRDANGSIPADEMADAWANHSGEHEGDDIDAPRSAADYAADRADIARKIEREDSRD